jgi:hypothetical protein
MGTRIEDRLGDARVVEFLHRDLERALRPGNEGR